MSGAKIAILLPDMRAGGVERVRLLLAEQFIARGYSVEFVLVRANGALMAEIPDGATVHDLACRRFRHALPRLVRYLRKKKPDVLLAAMWPITGIALVAMRVAGKRTSVVVSEHTDLRRSAAITKAHQFVLRLAGRVIYESARGVITVSRGVAESLTELTGLRPHQICVIYNPIRMPTNTLLPAGDPTRVWWTSGEAALISVGRMKPAKGYDTLIRAVEILRAEGRDVRLLLVGDGPEEERLKALVTELGMNDGVRFTGFVSDPFPWLREANLFVLSSRWEGLGNVITEALACGIPVVSTDCQSGPSELLDEGRYGRLVPVDDASAMARAISDSLAEVPDRARLVARAAEFGVDRAADAYIEAMGLSPQISRK